MNIYELIAFILYFVAVIGIGVYFFIKSKTENEKDYFLGGKNMGGLVAALSAGASDMSAWCLMGLPGAIYLAGVGQIWISVGLVIGTILAWVLVAPRLRVYAILADDSITVPQFLTNRFKEKSNLLKIACAVVFIIAYCIYTASSISACGDLFFTLSNGAITKNIGMIVATVIIVIYTMLGGFRAVCWTDFIQGLLMLAALMILPIIASIMLGTGHVADVFVPWANVSEHYFNILSTGKFDWTSISDILSGLAWGLGYFGMPHIIIRYMSIKNKHEMKKSQIVGSTWTFLILLMASVLALVSHEFLGAYAENSKTLIFVYLARVIFGVGPLALIGGILISAVIAASMSTADSQLLSASSAFASDLYKSAINPKASDKQMVIISRIVVTVIALLALAISLWGNDDIMSLVSAAWSIFGSAFGPVILLSLYWKEFNYKGCLTGIITGFIVSIAWLVLFNFEYYGYTSVLFNTQLYELLPGFIISLLSALLVTKLTDKPSKEVVSLFEQMENHPDLH